MDHADALRAQIGVAVDECRKMIADTTGKNFEEMAARLARRRLWIEEARRDLAEVEQATAAGSLNDQAEDS